MTPLALLAALTIAAPPPGPWVRYGSGWNPLEAVAKLDDAALTQQLDAFSKQVNAKVSAKTRAEKIAALAQLQRAGAQGAESDFLIPNADGSRTPVTLTWDLAGDVTLQSGSPVKELFTAGATADAIAAKYKLNAFAEDGAKWAPLELAAVDKALSMLSPEEVALLGGLGFRRKAIDPQGRTAYYRRADDGMTIDVFDKAFADKDYFVGAVDAPSASVLYWLIHEMAHAMSDFAGRQRAIASNAAVAEARALIEKAKAEPGPENTKAANEKTAAAKALRTAQNAADKIMVSKGRAAERSFAAVLPHTSSVTNYGRTSIDENLAEGFALSKLDSAALQRISAPALEWFKAGTFVKEATSGQ